MGFRRLLIAACCTWLFAGGMKSVVAENQPISIVIGQQATDLESFAAEQLQSLLSRLGKIEVTVDKGLHKNDSFVVLLGNPTSNPAITANVWPKLSDQGLVLKSIDLAGNSALVVGGGSDAATLWGVYELGHRLGVRYLLREDVYPQQPVALNFDNLNVVMEPDLKIRTWRTINDFAIGPESWPLADHKRFLGQLSKLKFNNLLLSIYPWQPFVHYECQGIKKQTAMLWFGEQYPIPRDAPGRTAFGTAKKFENPDFAGLATYDQMLEAGQKHVRGIIEEARRLGISVSLSISPLEFPQEFAAILPRPKDSRGINHLVVAPGKQQSYDDPTLTKLVTAKIRAYLKTYQNVDRLYLTLPQLPARGKHAPAWDEHVEIAWGTLAARIESTPPLLETLVRQATDRNLIASGKRGAQDLKGNIVAIAFLNHLFQDSNLLKRSNGKHVELVITALDPELFPYASEILPTGASTHNFIDYTARRVVDSSETLSRLPASNASRELIMTLADDNVGVLSQSATRRLETLVGHLRKQQWDGFSTRYWMLAELDPAVHFLARSAWDASVTARSDHDDLFATITSSQSVADRLWLAFGHIEQATELTDQNDLGFAFPVEGMLMKHYQPQPAPPWWKQLNEHYTQAMIELYRSHDAAAPQSRPLLFYWAKRSEYVLEYFSCVQAVRAAAIAQEEGDSDLALEQLETAIEQLYNALDTLSDVVRDQGDRGLIAVLNAYAYRPLVVEYEQLLSEVESEAETAEK